MRRKTKAETPDQYPALGRALLWLERPDSVRKIIIALYMICAMLFLADFVYHKKTYLDLEDVAGFYALYGFFMCAGLVICAKVMRMILGRRENYYAPFDTQSEAHPDSDLGRENIHD